MRETKPAATFADLDQVPETMIGQIIDGALLVLPRPALPHAQTTSNAGADINGRFGRARPPGGWWILDEPELRLSADALVPDLAGWRRERLPALPSEPFLALAADWVLEVLSPSTASIDRIAKARVYAREGVRWLWFIDPLARTIEVNRLEAGGWLRVGAFHGGEPLRAEPFEAVEFDTADWFATG
ncbi:MAG: Uma2 family endonuclease [Myxococcaceae bacterium]|nr:Uma2 family endonuclease [Myxococcaceae bacterium]